MTWETHPKQGFREGKFSKVRDMLAFVSMRRGELSISRRAWETLGKPKRIKFVTDSNGRGGFMSCDDDDPNGYKVQDIERGNVLRIGCKSVTTKYGLSDDTSNRVYSLAQEGDVLVFHLSQGFERM